MRIVKIEDVHADGGMRTLSFLKVTTDAGLIGWSEYDDSFSPAGASDAIRRFSNLALGMDPRETGRISATLHAVNRVAPGGVGHQAIAAIENACLDIQAKAMGIPVYSLFGGSFRDRIPVYWTRLGSSRVSCAGFYEKEMGYTPVRSLDDVRQLCAEAVARGFKAIKTNPILFNGPGPVMFSDGCHIAPGFLDRRPDSRLIAAITDQLAAIREGIGPNTKLMMDLGFNQRADGFIRVGKAVEPFHLDWLEIDIHDPGALAVIRRSTSTPVASLEAVCGLKNYRPYFQKYSVDVPIIDPVWNGVWESVRIASVADAYELNVSPKNYMGHLATLMSAHFCASVPNFRIMELQVEEAPWVPDLFTHPIMVEDGKLVVPDRPGWGTDVNEEAINRHPPKFKDDVH